MPKIKDLLEKEHQSNLKNLSDKTKTDLWNGLLIIKSLSANLSDRLFMNRWISEYAIASGLSEDERATISLPTKPTAVHNPQDKFVYGLLVGKKTLAVDSRSLEANPSIIAQAINLIDASRPEPFFDRASSLNDFELLSIILSPLILQLAVNKAESLPDDENMLPSDIWYDIMVTSTKIMEDKKIWDVTNFILSDDSIDLATDLNKTMFKIISDNTLELSSLTDSRVLSSYIQSLIVLLGKNVLNLDSTESDAPRSIFTKALSLRYTSSYTYSDKHWPSLVKTSVNGASRSLTLIWNSKWVEDNTTANGLSQYTILQRSSLLITLLHNRMKVLPRYKRPPLKGLVSGKFTKVDDYRKERSMTQILDSKSSSAGLPSSDPWLNFFSNNLQDF